MADELTNFEVRNRDANQAMADLTRDRHSDSYAKADCKAYEQLAGQIQGEGTE